MICSNASQDFGIIGFDLWQVKAGTIFDNVLITDSEAEQAAGAALYKKIADVSLIILVVC